MKKDIIVGFGQVGSAIRRCYGKNINNVLVYDSYLSLGPDSAVTKFMHICFDCVNQKEFISQVKKYMLQFTPEHVIIHSTVQVGTTLKIYNLKPDFVKSITFSPVIGKHPDLHESIKNVFYKFYSTYPQRDIKVTRLFSKLFNKLFYVDSILQLEFSKLLCTTRYGKDIETATEINRLCDKHGFDNNFVNNIWNSNYNQGYIKLGMNEYIRPILTPCKGKIGGHCIIPNIKKFKQSKIKTYLTKFKLKWLIK